MAPSSVSEPRRSTPDDLPTAAGSPPTLPPVDPEPVEHETPLSAPDLCRQLRGMFFARTFQEHGAQLDNDGVLRLACPLYADDVFRSAVAAFNRDNGREGLDLYIFRDELDDRAPASPVATDDFPPHLCLVAAALQLPPDHLIWNPIYIPTPDDVAWARANTEAQAAWGVMANPNVSPTEEDVAESRFHPTTPFAAGIFENPNFVPSAGDLALARTARFSTVSCVVSNPNAIPSDEDVAFARANLNGNVFTRAVVRNPNLVLTEGDIELARSNPASDFAAALMTRPEYAPTAADIAFARANPHTERAAAIAGNVNFVPTREDIEMAIRDPHSGFAVRVGLNPNYVPAAEDLVRVTANTGFASAVAQNVASFLRLPRVRVA